jgi:hypothetical protein
MAGHQRPHRVTFRCFGVHARTVYPERMTSAGSGPEPSIARAAEALEARWQDDAAHRSFIALCSAHGALAEAGRYYRTVRDRDPARRQEAERRLNAVLGAAIAGLDAQRAEARAARRPRKSRLFWLVCGVGLALLGCAVRAVLLHSTR